MFARGKGAGELYIKVALEDSLPKDQKVKISCIDYKSKSRDSLKMQRSAEENINYLVS